MTPTTDSPPSPTDRGLVRRILGHPLLHFLTIGALLTVASSLLEPTRPIEITVSRGEIERMRTEWLRTTGRPPDEREMDHLVQQFVDESLLVREARALGWDRSDSIVQQRLIRNLRFVDAGEVGRDREVMSDAALLEMAFDMGMEKTDIVVHRRLLERMKLTIGARARSREPTDAELEAYLEANAADFERPARIRLSHVFLSRDERGDSLWGDAKALRDSLLRESVRPEDASAYGDPLLLGSHLPLWSRRQIADRLGPEFADAVIEMPAGRWSTPVRSSYGAHLVWVHERTDAHIPTLEEARREVRASLLYEREAEALREAVEELRQGVEVRVERN